MSIPCKMRPVGLDSLPLGYTRLEFLESTGTQYIKTLIKLNPNSDIYCDVYLTNSGGHNIFGYREPLDGLVNAGTYIVPASAGNFINWRYNQRAVADKWAANTRYAIQQTNKQLIINGKNAASYNAPDDWSTSYTCRVFGSANVPGASAYFVGRFYSFTVKEVGVDVINLIPTLDSTGKPCMFDIVTCKPFYNEVTTGSDFIAGFDMNQAESLGSLIPANTTLTVSFPWEASLVQHNSRAESSLEKARDKGCTISVRYREPEKDSPIYNKYAECKTVDDMIAVNSDYRNDLTEDGAWEYALDKLESEEGTFFHADNLKVFKQTLPALNTSATMFQRSGLTILEIDLPVLVKANNLAYGCASLSTATINAPNATSMTYTVQFCYALTVLTGSFTKVQNGQSMAHGAWSLRTVEAEFPSLSNGSSMFYQCLLDKESALRILNSIPTWTSGNHELTIGIHVDYQNDEEVLTAIANAETKGWTVTVQWNGTATAQTASTFGLRKPPIYAKLGTVEHPDGTIENFLDWGHYVSNAEENGYQEFASVEEAYEHFNLEIPTEE